jgi:hypothetical protein
MLFQTVGSQGLHVTVNLRIEKEKAEKEKQQQQNSQSVGGCVVELELSHHMTSCFNQCRPCTIGMIWGRGPWSYESNSQTLSASMLAIATELGFVFSFSR